MAIRHVKTVCKFDYEDRTELDLGNVRVRLDRCDGTPVLSMDNGKNEQLACFHIETDELSHVDRVVAFETDYSVRIMSDVWADLTYAVVWEPTRMSTGVFANCWDNQTGKEIDTYPCGYFRRIQIGNTEFPYDRGDAIRAEIDADDDLMEVYQAWKRGQEWIRKSNEYDRMEHRVQEARRTIDRDKWVRVVRGRKVTTGTEGIVFWLGGSQWGTKVGIALPQADGTFRMESRQKRSGGSYETYADVVWTYAKNCAVISEPGGRVL